MDGPVREVQRLGQAIWYDNVRRDLLVSGELAGLIDQGVTGVTSNPTIFEKAVAGLQKKRGQGLVDWGIFFKGKRVNEKDNPTQERPKVFWP